MIRILTTIFLVIILLSCEKKEKNQDLPVNTDSLNTAVDSLKTEYKKNAPEWFNHIPQEHGYLYAAAEGKSLRANIAEQKALFKARVKLAEKFAELSQGSDDRASGPGADGESIRDERSIVLERSIVKQQKQILKGKHWHVFVLVEMKIDHNK